MANIDVYSVATVPILMLFESTELAAGTGFVWLEGAQHYVVTNWHNLSGKDPRTGRHLSRTNAEPDQVRVWWNVKGQLGAKSSTVIPIRSEAGTPLWLVHPTYGKRVDVVALPVQTPPNVEMYPINQMPTANDMLMKVGQDVFVLGYPFGIGPSGLPIWKRGSLASEPEVVDPSDPYILVDTASRPGMSGSPVIRRAWGGYESRTASLNLGAGDATLLVGIYSGRLSTSDPSDAQLGLTWPVALLKEIIAGGTMDI